VLVLFVSIYSQGKGKGYQFYNHQYVMLDKDGKKKSSLDFPSKIYPGAFKLYENQNPFPKGYSIETLKYALVYLKFKIPYKYKHAYERYGYMLHPPVHKLDSDKKYYLWGNIDLHLTNDLENQHLTSLKNTNLPSLEIVKNFFSDYPEYLDIKVAP
ncbi:MAG: hypothetical protein ACYS0I_19300, partial [Planctomycetota bacterium]